MMTSNNTKEKGFVGKGTPTNSNALNSLVQGTLVEGTINASSDIRIDGTVKGNLNCTAKVIIGASGEVQGQVFCENAIIEGNFEGKIYVKETLSVKKTAKIEGEVATAKLIVEAGAIFNVSCKMGDQIAAYEPTNQRKPVETKVATFKKKEAS